MTEGLYLDYDPVGDILYLGVRRPYPEQESEEIASGIVARFNPDTDEIESLEIFHYSARALPRLGKALPLSVDFRRLAEELSVPEAA